MKEIQLLDVYRAKCWWCYSTDLVIAVCCLLMSCWVTTVGFLGAVGLSQELRWRDQCDACGCSWSAGEPSGWRSWEHPCNERSVSIHMRKWNRFISFLKFSPASLVLVCFRWVAYSERGFTGDQYVLEKGCYPGALQWGSGLKSPRSLRSIRRASWWNRSLVQH